MKRRFTFLMAAFALLAFLAIPMGMRGQTTVIQTTFSSVSGQVDDDANVSYACYKGGGTSAPAVNSNAIRLYQNSANQTGGYVVIGVSEKAACVFYAFLFLLPVNGSLHSLRVIWSIISSSTN